MAPKCCPKPFKIDKKLNRAATTSKMQKKKFVPKRWQALGPFFWDLGAHFGIQNYTSFPVFFDLKSNKFLNNIFHVFLCFWSAFGGWFFEPLDLQK